MRAAVATVVLVLTAVGPAGAQGVVVTGQIVDRDNRQPLAGVSVGVPSRGFQRLTRESGIFSFELPAGEARLRFRRIGFSPKDTTVPLAGNDTVRLRIELQALAIALPAMAINGNCTNGTPFEEKPAILTAVFDQVRLNAEALRLLASERPFRLRAAREGSSRPRDTVVAPTYTDTVEISPLPEVPYTPRRVVYRTQHRGQTVTGVNMPQLSDLADTAFTNNHCLWYAGQTVFEGDSVVQVDFEPVERLANVPDLTGSIYLRIHGYQLLGTVTRLTRASTVNRGLQDYFTRAVFREIGGVPVLGGWELTNVFNASGKPPWSEIGRVIEVKWAEPPPP